MPTAAQVTFGMGGVWPVMDGSGEAKQINVNLKPSITYPAGTVLGEIIASPGVYGPYDNADVVLGLGVARCVLQYACVTDASGNIAFTATAGQTVGDQGQTSKSAPAWIMGIFDPTQLIGLDAPAVVDLGGRYLEGGLAGGLLLIPGA